MDVNKKIAFDGRQFDKTISELESFGKSSRGFRKLFLRKFKNFRNLFLVKYVTASRTRNILTMVPSKRLIEFLAAFRASKRKRVF